MAVPDIKTIKTQMAVKREGDNEPHCPVQYTSVGPSIVSLGKMMLTENLISELYDAEDILLELRTYGQYYNWIINLKGSKEDLTFSYFPSEN